MRKLAELCTHVCKRQVHCVDEPRFAELTKGFALSVVFQTVHGANCHMLYRYIRPKIYVSFQDWPPHSHFGSIAISLNAAISRDKVDLCTSVS